MVLRFGPRVGANAMAPLLTKEGLSISRLSYAHFFGCQLVQYSTVSSLVPLEVEIYWCA